MLCLLLGLVHRVDPLLELRFPGRLDRSGLDACVDLVLVDEPLANHPVLQNRDDVREHIVVAQAGGEVVAEEPAVQPDPPAEQEEVEDDTPYTFEELSDYTDEELRQVYEYWGLGEFPEKRSMAIKRILEVQEQGV